jgi:regulator of CtrA degradation
MFAATAFFERTYGEAWTLLREARDYLAFCEARGPHGAALAEQLHFSRETTRLTARLTAIMAWLLTQKAVAAGEIAPQEAASAPHRLLRRAPCLEHHRDGALPRGLSSLMTRSHGLYLRVARLDELLAREQLH